MFQFIQILEFIKSNPSSATAIVKYTHGLGVKKPITIFKELKERNYIILSDGSYYKLSSHGEKMLTELRLLYASISVELKTDISDLFVA